jgi:shikimate kinase
MHNKTILYLIGFMGSGKSTVGKKLASLLEWSFIDLDNKIEEKTGRTISELFSEYGEESFRKIESEVLRSLKYQTNTVISTGGGTPCFENNIDFMNETGLTMYLKLNPMQLKGRLSESKGERPLIKDLSNPELLGFIENKLAAREQYYSKAELHIHGFDIDYDALISLVKKAQKADI